jgi:hypothetical protein
MPFKIENKDALDVGKFWERRKKRGGQRSLTAGISSSEHFKRSSQLPDPSQLIILSTRSGFGEGSSI